jgi:hypothetical protein
MNRADTTASTWAPLRNGVFRALWLGIIPDRYDTRTFAARVDFVEHNLLIQTSDGTMTISCS